MISQRLFRAWMHPDVYSRAVEWMADNNVIVDPDGGRSCVDGREYAGGIKFSDEPTAVVFRLKFPELI